MSHLLRKFPHAPAAPVIVRGEGIHFVTEDGRRLLDMTSGVTGCAVLGFSHPAVLEAMRAQMESFCHMDYNAWHNPMLDALADALVARAPEGLDRVYFTGCSGSEAIEAALKLSYQIHCHRGEAQRTWYISRAQSFHGATLQAVAVTDIPIFDIYRHIVPDRMARVSEHNMYRWRREDETPEEYGRRCADELDAKIREIGPGRVCAFIGETMQGSLVGDVPPPPGYWRAVREVCDRHGVHLVLDEVYCGLGRSGKVHCCSWDAVAPDFLCVGKNLAAGYAPLSAVLTRSRFEPVIAGGAGRILGGHTYQGYSLGVAAALATQRITQDDATLAHIQAIGEHMRARLAVDLGGHSFFRNVRGRGILTSLEYACADTAGFSAALSKAMEAKGVYLSAKWHRTSFTPAYVVERAQVDTVLDLYVAEFTRLAWEFA